MHIVRYQSVAALTLMLIIGRANAIDTGALDPSFGQNGTVSINALTGAESVFCPVIARQFRVRYVLGCNLDGAAAVVGLRDDGTLDPQFGDAGISVLPNVLWNQNALIRTLSAFAEITVVQVPTATNGGCGNRSLITRLDRNGRQVPGYGGLTSGYRIFELEPFGFFYSSCLPVLSNEWDSSISTLTLPVGASDSRPALVSLDQWGGIRSPFQPVRRLGEFRTVSAIVSVQGNTFVGGMNAQDVAQIRAYNQNGDAISAFGNGGNVLPPSPGVGNITFPLMIHQPLQGAPFKLLVVSSFSEPPRSGLLVSRYWLDGAPDLTFGGSSGNPAGSVLIPDALFGDQQSARYGDLFLDRDDRIVLFATTFNNFDASQATAVRLLPDGRFDPNFRSGAEAGVVRITKQNIGSTAFRGFVVDEKLVYLETWGSGQQRQLTVSRLRGNQTIFTNGFEAP